MGRHKRWFLTIVFLFILNTSSLLSLGDYCPPKCVCKRIVQEGKNQTWLKIRCGDDEKLNVFESDVFAPLATDVAQLNLSSNNLESFHPNTLYPIIKKLDLSDNQLTVLTANQFVELSSLRQLYLTGNKIKYIHVTAFTGLTNLERLRLNQNQIITIEKNSFNSLINLKQLDISVNPLKCDCELLWLLEWTRSKVKLLGNPKCATPETFSGKMLRKLKENVEYRCESPAKNLTLPMVEISPANSQVVFEGDSLKLKCQAPRLLDSFDQSELENVDDKIEWKWMDSNPKLHFNNMEIEERYVADTGMFVSMLKILKLHRNHSGIWNCNQNSQRGNHSKSITIVVINEQTQFCPVALTTNNKGVYHWPRTIVNHTVSLECEAIQLRDDIASQRATYHCSALGRWEQLDTSKCRYISNITNILEQFSLVKVPSTIEVVEHARHLKQFTSNLKDVMDLVFLTRTIENFLFLSEYEYKKELSVLLMDVINNFFNLDSRYMMNAEIEDESCTKLRRCVETMAKVLPPAQRHKNKYAVDEFKIIGTHFSGLECTWYSVAGNSKFFKCSTDASKDSFASNDEMSVEASIYVPPTLFYSYPKMDFTENLVIIAYSQSKLFPVSEEIGEVVTSDIIGVKLNNMSAINLTEPIFITLKPSSKFINQLSTPTPVWFNESTGLWSSAGCVLIEEADLVKFTCDQLGYYALTQDITQTQQEPLGAKFHFSHPAIYVGSVILLLCLLFSILSYTFAYSTIQMPKKAKHSLANTWMAILLLCLMYLFGIYQTEDVKMCRVIGLTLHYLTLSSLLWMCVSVNIMYKRLRKNNAIELQDDELPSAEPIQKPILGLYLVGWGVAMIICGISGAVNMKDYATYSRCFLNSGPSLSALYIPCIILFVFLSILFLLIRCAIYSTDANGHLSEGTQATENVDLDLLEPNFPNVDAPSISSKTASSEIEDPEHAPMAQLKAYIKFLILYTLTWTFCALATIKPIRILPYEEDIFSVLYALFATLLGVFTLFFYCVARRDVRSHWVLSTRWFKRLRSRNVSDTNQNMPIQIQQQPAINTQSDLNFLSRSSSRSSTRTKSASHNSHVFKAAVDLNGTTLNESINASTGTKINNVNLVVLHRQQYRNSVVPNLIENPTHSAEMFYNPHQSTVARKFFKKQKRNMMKHNNITRRADLNSDTASVASKNIDTSLFANNSKVNNTNIHIEKIPSSANKNLHKNLNVFSDSTEELNNIEIPVDKLMMRRKEYKRSKKRQNIPPQRTVSQQCTLEYHSSEAEIPDSILDSAKSPELKPEGRIYVNPSHEYLFPKRAQSSRASSVSASEIDELYQQIKRGPVSPPKPHYESRRDVPYQSDSEVNQYVNIDAVRLAGKSKESKDETTV